MDQKPQLALSKRQWRAEDQLGRRRVRIGLWLYVVLVHRTHAEDERRRVGEQAELRARDDLARSRQREIKLDPMDLNGARKRDPSDPRKQAGTNQPVVAGSPTKLE